jgi:hypothetical protein
LALGGQESSGLLYMLVSLLATAFGLLEIVCFE